MNGNIVGLISPLLMEDLSCLLSFVITNNATINSLVYVSLSTGTGISVQWIPWYRIIESKAYTEKIHTQILNIYLMIIAHDPETVY